MVLRLQVLYGFESPWPLPFKTFGSLLVSRGSRTQGFPGLHGLNRVSRGGGLWV